MSSRKGAHHKKKKHKQTGAENPDPVANQQIKGKKLEIVLKCDTAGCLEAVISSIGSLSLPEVEIEIISTGVGAVNKSDIFMAESGSRLILGFNVGIMVHLEQVAVEHNIEIRLYEVIYNLLDDLESIAKSLIQPEPGEEIIGSAKIIALFKSSRRSIILGCEVLKGKLKLGDHFRVLGAMGLLYTGKIESLHIEKDTVTEATKGQQVGLKIKDFNKAKIGDLVETFVAVQARHEKPWQPQGKIYYPG
jgi:translation initiation factor IF-2